MRLNNLVENHSTLTDRSEILDWLRSADIHNTKIHKDGTVDVMTSVRLPAKINSIPVKFDMILGDFQCNDTHLSSFENFPSQISGSLIMDGMPYLTSLSGIHKHIKYVGSFISVWTTTITSSILGLLLIKNVHTIICSSDDPQLIPFRIVNKHLETRDLNLCQEELIEAGYPEYAKL